MIRHSLGVFTAAFIYALEEDRQGLGLSREDREG
jgi:hypothetical protein